MAIAKLKTKQFIGASLNNIKDYFNKINEIIDNLNSNSSNYKAYVALLTQSGTNAPTTKVLQNTIGNISWVYTGVGSYKIILPVNYDQNKTFIMMGNGDTNAFGSFVWAKETGNPNEITFYLTKVPTLFAEDDLLADTAFELRIYN